MTSQSPFRLLHISDLHFKEGGFPPRIGGLRGHRLESYGENEEKTFLRKLEGYLKGLPRDHWPKAVIVNGDLVDAKEKGQAKFKEATEFLKKLAEVLGFEDNLERIYVVPGNHDVSLSREPNAKPVHRFSNYLRAVEPFTSPTLEDDGPSPRIVKLKDKFGIDAELFLLVSPTFSGVSETVESLLDRFIKTPEEEELTVEVKKTIEEVKKAKEEVKKVLDREGEKQALERGRWQFDLGSIGIEQCDKIREHVKKNREGNPIRIAVLHHHLVPEPGTTLQPYDAVINGAYLLDLLLEEQFDLVLTGHKHYRRFVRYRVDEKHELDIYSSPSLFLPYPQAPCGFTIIDIWDAQAPHYASLHYFDMNCTPYGSDVKLLREGQVSRKLSKVCADITTDDQEVVLPLLESMRSALKWSLDHPAKELGLFNVVWEEIKEDLDNLGKGKLVLQPSELHMYWEELIQHVASKERNSELRLVSEDDLDFWLKTERHNKSDAAMYEDPLKGFEGDKTRILVMDSSKLERDENEAKKLVWVVKRMEEEGYRVVIIRKERVPRRVDKRDFAIVGESAVTTFEDRVDDRDTKYSRALTMSFDEEDVEKAEKNWTRLKSNLDWDSSGSRDSSGNKLCIRNWVNYAYGHNLTQADLEGTWEETENGEWILKKESENEDGD